MLHYALSAVASSCLVLCYAIALRYATRCYVVICCAVWCCVDTVLFCAMQMLMQQCHVVCVCVLQVVLLPLHAKMQQRQRLKNLDRSVPTASAT